MTDKSISMTDRPERDVIRSDEDMISNDSNHGDEEMCGCGRPMSAIRSDDGSIVSYIHTNREDEFHHMDFWLAVLANMMGHRQAEGVAA